MNEEGSPHGKRRATAEAPWASLLGQAVHVDLHGRILAARPGPEGSRESAPPIATLSETLPEPLASRLMSAIEAAAQTRQAQVLEFDVPFEDGQRRIRAEASVDPGVRDRFLLLSQEIPAPAEARPHDDAIRAAGRLDALAQVQQDADVVFRQLAVELSALVRFVSLTVVTAHPDQGCQFIEFSTPAGERTALPLTGSAVEVVSRTGIGLAVPPTRAPSTPAGLAEAAPAPSVIVVPLHWAGDLQGFLTLTAPPGVEYDSPALAAVETMAAPAAAALASRHARGRQEWDRQANAACDAIAAVARAAGDLGTVVEVAADQLHRLSGYSRVAVSITGEALSATRDDGRSQALPGASSLSAPIGPPGAPGGAITVTTADPRGFGDRDRLLLRRVAQSVESASERLDALRGSRLRDRHLKALTSLDRLVIDAADEATLLNAAADVVQRLVPAARVCVALLEPGGDSLRRALVRGTELPGAPEGSTLTVRPGTLRRAIDRPRDSGLVDGLPVSPSEAGLKACMRVPLSSRGRVLGIIVVHAHEAEAFGPADLECLDRVAARMAPGLALLRAAEEAERLAAELACLRALDAALADAPTLDTILAAIRAAVRPRFAAHRVSLAVVDQGRGLVTEEAISGLAVQGWSAGSPRPAAGTPEAAAVAGSEGATSEGGSTDALVAHLPAEAAAVAAGLQAVVAIQLPAIGDTLTCLVFRRAGDGSPLPDAVPFLRHVARLVAGPLAAIRLQQTLKCQDGLKHGLDRMARLSMAPPATGEIYRAFADILDRLVEFQHLEITMVTDAGDTLRREYTAGVPIPGWHDSAVVPLHGTVAGSVLETGGPVIVSGADPADLVARFPTQAAAVAAGLRSLAAAPILSEGRPVGCVTLRSTAANAYSRADAAVLETAALHLSIALSTAQRRERARHLEVEYNALVAAADASARLLDPEAAAERVADEIAGVVPYDHLTVRIVAPEDDHPRTIHQRGDPVRRAPLPSTEPAEPAGQGLPGDQRFRSVIRASIGGDVAPLGELEVAALRPDAFAPGDVRVVDRMADLLTPVLQRAASAVGASRLATERDLRERLEQQNRDLRDQAKARDAFLQTVAHEFKTPLTAVSSHSQLLLEHAGGGLTPRQREQLEQVERNAARLNGLVDNLLDISRLEAGTFKLVRGEFDLARTCRSLCESLAPLMAPRRQHLELALSEDPLWLEADEARISNVLTNLVSNASKYSPDEAVIYVDVRRAGSSLQVAVRDRGLGISPEDRDRLFTPFFRGTNPAALAIPGTGLGLVIARSIIELHGGSLTIESEPGLGTTAQFTIDGAMDGPSEAHRAELEAQRRSAATRRP